MRSHFPAHDQCHSEIIMSPDIHQIIKRQAARWYGGKGVLGKWIISHFPSHKIDVEPFSVMWSVGLQKQPSLIEV